MFSWEIWEVFKNTYFEEHVGTTASKSNLSGRMLKIWTFVLLQVGAQKVIATVVSRSSRSRVLCRTAILKKKKLKNS